LFLIIWIQTKPGITPAPLNHIALCGQQADNASENGKAMVSDNPQFDSGRGLRQDRLPKDSELDFALSSQETTFSAENANFDHEPAQDLTPSAKAARSKTEA
jgi:hypothetical protein